MNILRQLLIAVVLMFGVALSVSAQKNDDRPPKKPPVIPVQPREPKDPPRGNPPRDDDRNDRPKKPESYFTGSNGEVISN